MRSEDINLTYPDSATQKVGEVTVSLAFHTYGDTRPYLLPELTAAIAGPDAPSVFLDQGRSLVLAGKRADYTVTALSIDVPGRSATVRIEQGSR